MKTLMGTDGSPEATTALRVASRFLRKEKNAVSVLCVAPEPAVQARGSYRKRITKETESILSIALQVLAAEGVEAKSMSRFGSPAGVIQRLTDEYDVTVV